jgi:hypothetical protein
MTKADYGWLILAIILLYFCGLATALSALELMLARRVISPCAATNDRALA